MYGTAAATADGMMAGSGLPGTMSSRGVAMPRSLVYAFVSLRSPMSKGAEGEEEGGLGFVVHGGAPRRRGRRRRGRRGRWRGEAGGEGPAEGSGLEGDAFHVDGDHERI